ncbi:MAG: EamA/RhaT family transporter, partial [Desulfomonilaceae bacterium]
LSLTLPLLSFTPAITIVTASVLLGETIGSMGLIGVLLVTLGAYILNVDPSNFSVLGPVKAVLSDSGARRMLMVSILWAVTSTLGKSGVLIFGALQFGYLITGLVGAIFMIVGIFRVKLISAPFVMDGRIGLIFLIAGVFMSLQEVTHFLAVSMAPVAYMISVKRISMVIGVIFGWRFFGETNIASRLTGSVIMLAGVVLLSGLSG